MVIMLMVIITMMFSRWSAPLKPCLWSQKHAVRKQKTLFTSLRVPPAVRRPCFRNPYATVRMMILRQFQAVGPQKKAGADLKGSSCNGIDGVHLHTIHILNVEGW